jgi:hypothetical protein
LRIVFFLAIERIDLQQFINNRHPLPDAVRQRPVIRCHLLSGRKSSPLEDPVFGQAHSRLRTPYLHTCRIPAQELSIVVGQPEPHRKEVEDPLQHVLAIAQLLLRPLALGDVLKRAIETNRLAIAALGFAQDVHPDVPAPRGHQREFEIERGARVDGGLYGGGDDRPRFRGVELDPLGNRRLGGGIDLMDAVDLLGPVKGLRVPIQLPSADFRQPPGLGEQVARIAQVLPGLRGLFPHTGRAFAQSGGALTGRHDAFPLHMRGAILHRLRGVNRDRLPGWFFN